MKVIQGRGRIGEDRVLQVQLPDDAPVGDTDVVVVIDAPYKRPSREERLTAFDAARGAYKGVGLSMDEYRKQRRAEEERHERALGL